MKILPGHLQKALMALVCMLALVFLLVIIVSGSLDILYTFGEAVIALLGLICIGIGYLSIRTPHQPKHRLIWQKEPNIWLGVVLLVIALVIFIDHLHV